MIPAKPRSDSISASMKYCAPSKKGLRLALIAAVALGNIKEYTQIDSSLQAAPPGYDSCHGVRSTEWREVNVVRL